MHRVKNKYFELKNFCLLLLGLPTSPANFSLLRRFRDTIYPEQNEALRVWSIGHQEEPPSPTACTHQKAWDTPIVNAAYDQLLESTPNDMSRARLLAAHTHESGVWLNALPVSALRLRMDDDTVCIAIVLELPCAYLMSAITVGL